MSKRKHERNAEIVRRVVERHETLQAVGDDYGLSRERVRQIVSAAGAPSGLKRQEMRREAKAIAYAVAVVARRELTLQTHGTRYRYMLGCKCEECRRAARDYQRSLRKLPPPNHGVSGYMNYGCRCDFCRSAAMRYWRSRPGYGTHQLVRLAVKRGELVKPERCEDCGQEERLQGHHEDYSKPLDVIWLCILCHSRRHHPVPKRRVRAVAA